MKTTEKPRHRTYNAYHHNDALLLQFFLSEFIASHSRIENLTAQYASFARQLEKRGTKKNREKALQGLISSTRNLTGACYDSMPLLYWDHDHGLLHKLNNYAALFSRNNTLEGTKPKKIYQNISQALLVGVQIHDMLLTLQNASTQEWSHSASQIAARIDKLANYTKRVAKMLPSVIKEYGHDENVLFFVIRHHQELDRLYFEGFVKEFLVKIYSNGLEEAKKLLTRKYRSRGFNQLLPIIAAKIDNLQNRQ